MACRRYAVGEFPESCPGCGVAPFVQGRGCTHDATALTLGMQNDEDGGFDGAVSRYRCFDCGHQWEVTFPHGSVFMA